MTWVEQPTGKRITPSEILEDKARKLMSKDIRQRMYWEDKFQDFKDCLYREDRTRKGKRLTASTRRTILNRVASFFSNNGLSFNMPRGFRSSIKPSEEETVEDKWVLSKEEIRSIYVRAGDKQFS